MMQLSREHRIWFRTALACFVFAAALGAWMRYAFLGDWSEFFAYSHVRHGHSHVAMLGWLYGALYMLIVFLFQLNRPFYHKLFWLTQITVLGMAISFPLQGYKVFSIIFVTLHGLFTYAFIFAVWKDLKGKAKRASTLFLKTALVLIFVSSMGTWALAGMMANELKGSAWYYGSIQFYLHFQFNGWFVFGSLALFFKLLEWKGVSVNKRFVQRFYYLLLVSTALTFALAVTWSTPVDFIFWLNSVGVIIQLLALFYFMRIMLSTGKGFSQSLSPKNKGLFQIALFAFILKIVMQSLVALPQLATVSYTVRNFVIGFIHLLVLGCISLFVLAAYRLFRPAPSKNVMGIDIFFVGFLLSELLLFVQGFMLWMEMGFMRYYYLAIFIASIFMPLGLLIYFVQEIRQADKV